MKNRLHPGISLAICALLCAPRARAEVGEHVVVGSTTITPSVDIGLETSTNPYHSPTLADGSSATNLLIAPAARLELSRDTIDFDASGRYEARKYIGEQDSALDRWSDFEVTGQLDALKTSTVGIRANEGIGLVNYPADPELPDRPYTTQFRNQTDAAVVVRPGEMLDVLAGARYSLDDYWTIADSTGERQHYNTRNTIGPMATVAWKFMPSTAIAVDFNYDHSTYSTPSLVAEDGTTYEFYVHDMVRVLGGLRGRASERMSVTAMAGYGSAVYDGGASAGVDGVEGILVDLSVAYAVTEDDSVSAGFEKDFRDSYFSNYAAYSRGFATGEVGLVRDLKADATLSASAEHYRGGVSRDDTLLGAGLDLVYSVQEWSYLSAGGLWQGRTSSDDSVAYQEALFHLTATFVY